MNTQRKKIVIESRRASRRPSSSSARALRSTLYASRASGAFTIVELLVVISIIALLLGIIVPSYFSIREKAKYTTAKVTAKNLETAFKAYLDHYRTWPASAAFGAGGAAKEIDETIVRILIGDPTSPDDNKDRIAFYEFATTNSAVSARDPFTDFTTPPTPMYYRVQVDDNYDNKIEVGGKDIYRTVIVWSVGTNRSDGISESAAKEGNVRSWD